MNVKNIEYVNVYSQLSGCEDVDFNDFIKDDFIQEVDGQVTSGSVSLPDPVTLETEENEHDVLETLGDYKCDTEMSVENVSEVVNTKTLKGRFYCTQVLYWMGGGDGEECGKEEECCWPVYSQV